MVTEGLAERLFFCGPRGYFGPMILTTARLVSRFLPQASAQNPKKVGYPGIQCTAPPLALLAHRQDRSTSVTPFSNQHEVALVSIIGNQSDTTLHRVTENSNNNNTNSLKNNQMGASKLQDKLTLADEQGTTKKYKEYVQPSSMIHSQLGHFPISY